MSPCFVTPRADSRWSSANSNTEVPAIEPEVQPKPDVLPPATPVPFEKPTPENIPDSPEPVPLPVESDPAKRTGSPFREEEPLPLVEIPRKGC